jgi:hypothetical protein
MVILQMRRDYRRRRGCATNAPERFTANRGKLGAMSEPVVLEVFSDYV